jgi:hypothetical protein
VLVSVAAVALVASACRIDINSDFDEPDPGDLVTETFDIDSFTELDVRGAFTIDLEVGPDPSLSIEIDENLVDDLDVSQTGDRLEIEVDRGWFSTSSKILVTVTTPDLESVDLDGAVSLAIDGLDAETFDLDVDGASSVEGNGSVTILNADLAGASSVDFDDVDIDRADINVAGASSLSINGAARVEGSVSGASSVDVSDSASLTVETAGASSVD